MGEFNFSVVNIFNNIQGWAVFVETNHVCSKEMSFDLFRLKCVYKVNVSTNIQINKIVSWSLLLIWFDDVSQYLCI